MKLNKEAILDFLTPREGVLVGILIILNAILSYHPPESILGYVLGGLNPLVAVILLVCLFERLLHESCRFMGSRLAPHVVDLEEKLADQSRATHHLDVEMALRFEGINAALLTSHEKISELEALVEENIRLTKVRRRKKGENDALAREHPSVFPQANPEETFDISSPMSSMS